MGAMQNVEQFKSKVSVEIEKLVNDRARSSEHTAKAIHDDFDRFIGWAFGKSVDTVTATELNTTNLDKIMEYRDFLLDEGRENSTVNRYISSVKTSLLWLKTKNVLKSEMSYLNDLKNLKQKSDEIEYMPLEVVDRYIHEAGSELNYPLLKQALIMFAVDTGLRLRECLNFRKGQFILEDDHVLIKGWGKGDKQYLDKIDYKVYKTIMKATTAVKDEDKIFAPLSPKNITDMMTKFKVRFGYTNRNYSFHSFKKTAVTHAYRVTGDILEAQRKGRHSSLDTTRKYLKAEEYGITGVFSLTGFDDEAYKKVDHETLVSAIEEMGKDFKHLLNLKLNNNMKNVGEEKSESEI